MSDLKRLYVEDLLLGIQKTFTSYNYNINIDSPSPTQNLSKKIKHFHYPSFSQSLINNHNILKITHHNVMSFVNPIKQNQII